MGEACQVTRCPPAFTYATDNEYQIALSEEDRAALREHSDKLMEHQAKFYNRFQRIK